MLWLSIKQHGDMTESLETSPKARPTRSLRGDYKVFHSIATRWADNDAYGHVNNVVYYSWFDTAVNAWLIKTGSLNLGSSPVIGLVVDTGCSYFESVSFPETVDIGLRVEALGRSSVTYAIGVFKHQKQHQDITSLSANTAIAQGRFTHVFVERSTQLPVAIPDEIRTRLVSIKR
jgi:acyl-CoA thioester hydrolase